jgi:hypothetical protein
MENQRPLKVLIVGYFQPGQGEMPFLGHSCRRPHVSIVHLKDQ